MTSFPFKCICCLGQALCWMLQKIRVKGAMHGYMDNSQHLEHSPVSRSVVSFLYLFAHLILPKLYEEGPVGLYYKRLGSLKNLTGLASWLGRGGGCLIPER